MTETEARKVFKDCLARWYVARASVDQGTSAVTKESASLCSRKEEEYLADFERLCRKAKGRGWLEWLRGGGRDPGGEAALGETMASLQPYPLWSRERGPQEYFEPREIGA